MAQGLHLTQGLALQQVLSPQMQQSLALLQAPIMELRAMVEQEMAQNPVLEELSAAERPAEPETGAGPATNPLDPAEPPADLLFDPATEKPNGAPVDDFQATLDRLSQLDQQWREHFTQSHAPLRQAEVEEEKRQFMFESLVAPRSLQDSLLEQLRLGDVPADLLPAAEILVGSLNDEGYLATSLEELAASTGLPQGRLETALRQVQALDPPGVAARDLRECLLLQLERAGRQETLAYVVVRDHLQALGRKRFAEIGRALGVYPDEVQDAAEEIAGLQPRPGLALAPDDQHYVVPEVSVTRTDDGFQVSVANDHLPRLRISHTYKDLLAQAQSSREVREYLREKIRAGKFLMRCLDQRQQTILSIAREIVNRQREFFEHGKTHLKPMTMAQVAEAVGVHETTVSRAVAGKFMDTPQGIVDMRALFTSGVATTDGAGVASTGVKELIADLIRHEDSGKPLSDDVIANKLFERGIRIARRTVAKYRDELRILPVNLRKSA